MGVDYKEKIRKLLALAESPNEHEAKAALLKARALMAEHKLTEAELQDEKAKNVKRIITNVTYSKRKNPWIMGLSAVIGENYCCLSFRRHVQGKQTQSVGFIGLEDDVQICETVFQYAVDCVLAEIKCIRRSNSWRCSDEITKMCNSYGYGFENGLDEAFKKQQEQNESEWALVMVMPKEVSEAAQDLGHKAFNARAIQDINESYYSAGYLDGTKFSPRHRLAE